MSSSVFGHLTCTCLPYQQLYHAETKKKPRILILFEKDDSSSKEGKGGKLSLEGIQYISFLPGVGDYNSSFKKLMKSLRKKGVYVTFSLQLSSNVDNNSTKPKFGVTACCLLKERNLNVWETYCTISHACIVGIGISKGAEGSGSGEGGSGEGGSGEGGSGEGGPGIGELQ